MAGYNALAASTKAYQQYKTLKTKAQQPTPAPTPTRRTTIPQVSQKTVNILQPIAQWSGRSDISQVTAADVNRYLASGQTVTPTVTAPTPATYGSIGIGNPFTGQVYGYNTATGRIEQVNAPRNVVQPSQQSVNILQPIAQWAGKSDISQVTAQDIANYNAINQQLSPPSVLGQEGGDVTAGGGLGYGGYDVETREGQVFMVLRNQAGDIVDVKPLGAAQQTGLTEYQKAELDYANRQLALQQSQYYGQQTSDAAALALQREMALWQQEEAKRQYMSKLAAQPRSWLEYAAYTGQQPVVQPWMLPLMPEQAGFNVGGAIPGWSAEDMSRIPELLTPSAQYLARMGPTSQQQYYGYQQARTGASPEETQWRLWSQAPPSGLAAYLRRER